MKFHRSLDWGRNVDWQPGGLSSLTLPSVPSEPSEDGIPFVIYRRREKLRPEGSFQDLRSAFISELRKATYLVANGYGFKDEHINALISRWINSSRDRKLIIVDPSFPDNWAQPGEGRMGQDRARPFFIHTMNSSARSTQFQVTPHTPIAHQVVTS